MASRSPSKVSRHDRVVKKYAKKLEQDGWSDVYADVAGYGNPARRNGHVPDVSAQDGSDRLAVEVETDTSDDPSQRKAFKDWASGSIYREYRGILAKPGGSWTQFESE